jgi:predicted deacylase
MRHLGMLPGAARANDNGLAARLQVIHSPLTGIFRPAVRDGYAVAEGGLLGHLLDEFGDPAGEVRAPFAGVVNYVLGTPPVTQGEPLAMVSRIEGESQQ